MLNFAKKVRATSPYLPPYIRHQIPASFCIDPDNEKLLTCPHVGLEKGAMVYKCCPFGKQLKLPLFSGKTKDTKIIS